MDKIFLQLRKLEFEFPDGFIVSLGQLEPIDEGWVVSMKGAQNFTGESGMLEAIKVAERTTMIIGGWRDADETFWDVVFVFSDEDEATRAGKENDQFFIYQIETGRIKWLS